MYFPKSQIKPNLYTSGRDNKILYLDMFYQQVYSGYYYEISTGEKYTGKKPGEGQNLLLYEIPKNLAALDPNNGPYETEHPKKGLREVVIDTVNVDDNGNPTNEEQLNKKYLRLQGNRTSLPTLNPLSTTTTPTPLNYQEGKFTRYFTKKTNELKYKEISENTYKKLKSRDEQIAWDLYEPEKIEWEISGNKQIIARNNKQKVIKIEQNRRWYGFSKFLKEDYTKYWKP